MNNDVIDILIADKARKEIREATTELKAFYNQFLEVGSAIDNVSKKSFKISSPKEFVKVTKEAATVTGKLNDNQKETKRLLDGVRRSTAQSNQAMGTLNKTLIKKRYETQQLNKLQKEEAILTSKVSTFYQKQNVILNKLTRERQSLILKQQLGEKLSKEEIATLARLTRSQEKLDAAFKKTDATVGRHQREVGNYSKALSGLKGVFTGLVGAFGVVEGIRLAWDFTKEAIQLAREAQGVEFAFNRLGASGVDAFERVKKATRGLLSDLSIKTALNEFDQFNLSVERADTLFEFLAVAASQTGKSIDELKSSLVEGLSKESKLRIDNLGISTAELNAELEKTPNFLDAVANIAERKVAAAGDILDEAANGGEKFAASMENLKLAIGQLFGGGGGGFLGALSKELDKITKGVDVFKKGVDTLRSGLSKIIKPIRELLSNIPFLRDNMDGLGSKFKSVTDLILNILVPISGLSRGLKIAGTAMRQFGAFLSGMGAAFSTIKTEIKEFVTSLSTLSEIEFNPLNPVKSAKSAKKVLASLYTQFKEGGKSVGEAYSEAYENAINSSSSSQGMVKVDEEVKKVTKSVEYYSQMIAQLEGEIKNLDKSEIDLIRTKQAQIKQYEAEIDSILGVKDAQKETKKALEGSIGKYEEVISAMKKTREETATTNQEWGRQTREIEKVEGALNKLKVQFEGVGKVQMQTTEATKEQSEAFKELAGNAKKASDELESTQERNRKLAIMEAEATAKIATDTINKIASGFSALNDLSSVFAQNEFDRIDKRIDKNNEYYANLLDSEGLSQNQRDALEAERDAKNIKLQKKREEAEKKAFLIKQAFALAQIGIDLARTIVAINLAAATIDAITFGTGGLAYRAANIPFAIGTAAAQVAVVAAQTIPQFKDGHLEGTHEGLAYINDADTRDYMEVVERKDGRLEMFSGRNTLIDMDRGDKVHKAGTFDVNKIIGNTINMSMLDQQDKITRAQQNQLDLGAQLQNIFKGMPVPNVTANYNGATAAEIGLATAAELYKMNRRDGR